MRLNIMVANVALLLVTIIWGSTFFVIKKSLGGIHALTLIYYRFLLATIVMGIVLICLRLKPWQHVTAGLWLGLLLFVAYLTQTLALYTMTIANAGFIAGLFVIFVPLFSGILGREKLQPHIIGAIILAIIGLWQLTGGIKNLQVGDYLMLVSAVTFALYILYADLVVRNGCNVWVLNFQQFFVVALCSYCSMVWYKLPLIVPGWHISWGILYLALFANVLSYVVQLNAQKIIFPTACALILSLEPVFAAVFAWTMGGEKIVTKDIIGGAMIIIATILAQIYYRIKID